MDDLEKAKTIARCLGFLEQDGVRVEQYQRFGDFREIVSGAGKDYLTPFSDPLKAELSQTSALFLVAWKDDLPAMIGCTRLEDLGDESIEDYWLRSYTRAYHDHGGFPTGPVPTEIKRNVGRRLVYFGDLFVARHFRRSVRNLRSFTTIGHLAVSIKWDPDWTYLMMHDKDVRRGAFVNYGFNWAVPKPFHWKTLPPTRSHSEWACFLERQQLPGMVRSTMASLQEIKDA